MVRIADYKYLELENKSKEELKEIKENIRKLTNQHRLMDTNKSQLHKNIYYTLADKCVFGQSRDTAKNNKIAEMKKECERTGETFNITNMKLEGIYSFSTFENYQRIGSRFADWMQEHYPDEKSINKASKRVEEFLEERKTQTKSSYTLSTERAGLSKLFNRDIEIELPRRRSQEITRGRSLSKMARGFREDLNQDLVNMAKGTGGRRSDIKRLKPSDFVYKSGICIGVNFKGSKGGRDRYSPILTEYQKEITSIVNRSEIEKGKDKRIFKTVNSKANIHGYRKEYTVDLFIQVKEDKDYRNSLIKEYNNRGYHYDSEKYGRIETPYKSGGFVADRLDLWVVSQSLGHNRIQDTMIHYLR